MIACLGWGSLVWDSRALPVSQPWRPDGPPVRVEFLRESNDKRITLVLDGSAAPVQCLWAPMTVYNLQAAVDQLAAREKIPAKNIPIHIGSWSRGAALPSLVIGLEQWTRSLGIEHVVWTALPAKFKGIERQPSCSEVIEHLNALPGPDRTNAEVYVRRTPIQIDTVYRRAIAAQLGWTEDR